MQLQVQTATKSILLQEMSKLRTVLTVLFLPIQELQQIMKSILQAEQLIRLTFKAAQVKLQIPTQLQFQEMQMLLRQEKLQAAVATVRHQEIKSTLKAEQSMQVQLPVQVLAVIQLQAQHRIMK